MTNVITSRLNDLSNPTSLTTVGPFTLSGAARYLVRWGGTSPGGVMTVSNGKSHLIQNEGTQPLSVNTTGNSSQTVLVGEQLMVAWDQSQTKHEIQLIRATKPSVFNGQYTLTLIDESAQQCTLPSMANVASTLAWQIDGLTGGTGDAIYTLSTGVLNWAGKSLVGRAKAGNIITYQYQQA